MAWRLRSIRRVVGVVLVLLVAYLAWLLSHVRRPPVVVEQDHPRGQALPPRASEEIGCADNYSLNWTNRHLEADKACKNPDGSFTLTGVTLHVPRAPAGEVVVNARDGILPDTSGSVVILRRGVHVTTDDGFILDGDELEMRKETTRVTTG